MSTHNGAAVRDFLGRLKGHKPHATEPHKWEALCPAHDDQHRSLSVGVGKEGQVLLHCFAGCTAQEIVAALDLTMRDLFPRGPESHRGNGAAGKPKITAVYPYVDEEGEPLFEVCRIEPGPDGKPKTFRQRKPDGTWNVAGVRPVPYRLPRLLAAPTGTTIYVVEGEKDVHTLEALGLVGTTNAAGAGKWKPELNEHFRDRDVAILPDNDEPGRRHARSVAAQLRGVAASVKVVQLPGLAEKQDVTDWVLAGGTREKLLALVEGCGEAEVAGPPEDEGAEARVEGLRPVLVTMDTVVPKDVDWLWQPWIPLGMLTLMDGDPGLGKSSLCLDLAARVSRGWGMPGSPEGVVTEPAAVLLLSAEDSLSHTIRPRLDAADADPALICSLEAFKTCDGERPPILPFDVEEIETIIRDRNVRLVVIDPFLAYLDGQVHSHVDQEVRRVLHRLKLLAERTGVAIILVRHLNKLDGAPALYRGGGSIGIVGAVRSALVCGYHPDNKMAYVLAANKCNLAAMPRSRLYQVVVSGKVGRIAWGEETDLMANEILGHRKAVSAVERCEEKIRELLPEGRHMTTREFEETLANAGFSERVINRARRALGVKSQRVGYGQDGAWMVTRPAQQEDKEAADD
jgi:hypothetical protein